MIVNKEEVLNYLDKVVEVTEEKENKLLLEIGSLAVTMDRLDVQSTVYHDMSVELAVAVALVHESRSQGGIIKSIKSLITEVKTYV